MAEWAFDPKWGWTSDGRRVWVEWWLTGDVLKSVYTRAPQPVPEEEDDPETTTGGWLE